MISFRRLPIPGKIVAITMIISAAALLLASAALIAYDFSAARQELAARATVFAQIVAYNTAAAVQFNDMPSAVEPLRSLRAEPSVLATCIYTNKGLFASYAVNQAAGCSAEPSQEPENRNIVVASSPIEVNGRHVGTVQVRASLAPAYAQLRLEVAIIGGILVMAGLFALALSSRLHKFISEPILSLAKTANEVSRLKDYSIRASTYNEDELGVLVNAFNEMLAQIQQRDRELQQRASELLQASRMKDEFLATLSHELRTPLNSILGWSVLVQQGLPQDRIKAAFDAIERNARVQARLIEDLLDVSRIVSGKFTLERSAVVLNHTIQAAIDVVRPAADAKHIRIDVQQPSSEVTITGDAARLQQVVWNLLSNAVKFTREGGEVTVRLYKAPYHAGLSVSDNGIGIAPEFLPYVFDRFRQADGSSTRKHGGLGLGLAIVRHIVEMHGGSVSVESAGEGKGTKFTIRLPLRAAEEQLAEDVRGRRA